MIRENIESLFKTHYARMYRLAFSILFDEAESKDVVSDVFASLLDDKMVLMPEKAEGYLMVSVRNRCRNVLEHKQVRERFVRLQTDDGTTSAQSNAADGQLQMQELIRYVEENLSPMERKVFQLRYLKELTCKEIAEAVGVSRQTVHTNLRQAIEKVRMYFNSNS